MTSTKTKLLKKITRYFPDLHWKSAKYVSTGYDNDVIILDNTTIFRFPKHARAKKLLKGEVALLKILASSVHVSMPVYNFIAADYSCAQYSMIKGEGLTVRGYASLSISQKRKLAEQIAYFLSELHSVPVSAVKDCDVRERFTPQELRQLRKDAKKYLYPNFSPREMSIFETFFSGLTDVFQQTYKKVLVHGDFSGDHIIIDQEKNLTGVIDFTDRAIHDPAFDFVHMWGLGLAFVEAVYTYYGGNKSGILERSNAYAKASAIWNMVESVKQKTSMYNTWYRKWKRLNRL